jgi:paraquat-inducible protein A
MALHPQMTSVALLILATTVLLPTVQILAMLTLLLPLRFGRVPPGLRELSRVMVHVRPWAMVEVFLLGALVSLAKLAHLAHLQPGIALFAFGALIVLLALAASSFDERLLWQASGRGPREPAVNAAPTTAAEAGLMRCHACGRLQAAAGHDGHAHCERCGAPLHVRKPDGLSRTWALLIAACILYVPANVLPVMVTRSVVGTQSDTIMSGVIYLWTTGSWPLAALIFFASVMVPLLKIIALALLLFTAQRRSTWALQERTKLYRVVEFVGRWSMIDIFVVGVLAALVQFGALATIGPGPGAIAFGAVVVLTMLAAEAFDPRSLWDPVRGRESER